MPLVTIRVTGGSEAPTPEQKKELIRGATDLLVRVLRLGYSRASVSRENGCGVSRTVFPQNEWKGQEKRREVP